MKPTWDQTPLAGTPGATITPLKPAGAFHSVAKRILDERAKRLELGKRTLTFGVNFLDVALGGIFPNDLVLVGAKTGKGKTALATLIAMENAKKGKRVKYFALEAEEDEIERRIKFALVAEVLRQRCEVGCNYKPLNALNYLDWYAGRCDELTATIEQAADEEIAKRLGTLETFYRTTDFYAEHFETMVKETQATTDLFILDHLHYVDSEDPNENRGYKQIVKKIRDTALTCGKPVIVIAHLRKSGVRSTDLVPGIEDFHGTSDVPKIATKAIVIAPCRDEHRDPTLRSTFIAPIKCRQDGGRTYYVGKVVFDTRLNRYDRGFELGTVDGDEYKAVESALIPKWARQ